MVTGGGSVSPVTMTGGGALPSNPTGCIQTMAPASAETTAAALPPRRTSENRRSNKPIMEKRRRARINNCLNELKTLILDAMKKDPARHSKLEKADILEMTVKHLENLQRQQAAMSAVTDPNIVNKFRAGFSECAGEVGRFPGLEASVKRRLLQHLANCLNGTVNTNVTPTANNATHQPAVQVHILPSPAPANSTTVETHTIPTAVATSPNSIFFSTTTAGGLQLVPTRLPNGDIALVLPSTGPNTTQILRQTVVTSPVTSPSPSSTPSGSPVPSLVPVPNRVPSRTASTSSASSTSSGLSSSPVAFDRLVVSSPSSCNSPPSNHMYDSSMMERPYSPPMQKPLSLVIRKMDPQPMEEEKPWRPW